MSKGLEALEKITNYKCSHMSERVTCKEIIEKELKALEIIKEKRVDVGLLLANSLDTYNQLIFVQEKQLTQEEYDLLKEVLL